MRVLMGVIKDRHGTYYARKKVPEKLEVAVAKIAGSSRPRVSWLKASLRTKDLKQANREAKAHLAKFDRIIAEAEAAVVERPLRTSLTSREMERMAAYHYALHLGDDEARRTAGFSLAVFDEEKTNNAELLGEIRYAGARGDVGVMTDFITTLLDLSKINLDPASADYRRLGMMILTQEVEALEAIAKRNEGRPVATPKASLPSESENATDTATLSAAFAGWQKARKPSPSTLREYQHAIDRFIELHGDMPVVDIKRSHVRAFREALQDIPPRRTGTLRNAPLPALVEWRKENPKAERISEGTVNKLLGGVQAVSVWARDNGLMADDAVWADPFANMRLEEAEPEREPWSTPDLVTLFGSSIFTDGKRPKAGGGEAAFWLPLIGLFSGARLGELGPLRLSDIAEDAGIPFFSIVENEEDDKRLKTSSSRRAVPVHPELIRLGFLKFVDAERKKRGKDAPLFPELKPGPYGSVAESWSKWFGRYTNSLGIRNKSSVFHSFRHSFKDALRGSRVPEDMNDALTGHSGGGVGRKYGAKDMIRRYGAEALKDAVSAVRYAGLSLAKVSATKLSG